MTRLTKPANFSNLKFQSISMNYITLRCSLNSIHNRWEQCAAQHNSQQISSGYMTDYNNKHFNSLWKMWCFRETTVTTKHFFFFHSRTWLCGYFFSKFMNSIVPCKPINIPIQSGTVNNIRAWNSVEFLFIMWLILEYECLVIEYEFCYCSS